MPTSAIITHRHGQQLDGVFEAASVQLPPGTDARTATDTTVPFSPRAVEDDRQQGGWKSGERGDDSDEQPVTQPAAKRRRSVVASDSDSEGGGELLAEREFNIESDSDEQGDSDEEDW